MDDLEYLILDCRVGHVFEQGSVEGRDSVCLLWNRIFLRRNVREDSLDLLFHLVDIEISYHYYCLKVRTVPLVVEVQDFFPFEAVDDFEGADHGSFRLFCSLVYQSGLFRCHS